MRFAMEWHVIVMSLVLMVVINGCAPDDQQPWLTNVSRVALDQDAGASAVIGDDVDLVVTKLREHCQACHAVGKRRFLRSDNNAEVWAYLLSTKSPSTDKIWAKAMIEVLSWPNDTPPPIGELMDPPDRDWMPKGAKRFQLADDKIGERPVRLIILETLKKHTANLPTRGMIPGGSL